VEQVVGQVRADESRSAGDQDLHVSIRPFNNCRVVSTLLMNGSATTMKLKRK